MEAPLPRTSRGPAAPANSVTFVVGDGRQLLDCTPVFLTAGLARRLGGRQGHGGRAGNVARLQEEEGVVTAAALGRSWGAVPIRDVKDLPGKRVGRDCQAPSLRAKRAVVTTMALPSLSFCPLVITHNNNRTWFP